MTDLAKFIKEAMAREYPPVDDMKLMYAWAERRKLLYMLEVAIHGLETSELTYVLKDMERIVNDEPLVLEEEDRQPISWNGDD